MWRNSLLIVSAATGLAATQLPVWATGGKGAATPVLPDVVPTRSQQLSRLRDNSVDKPFDVLIIGGGATGTGCAVDATLRGMRTALVERGDFASGTSSKSTKLVHGGVRYLEKAVLNFDYDQLKLVYEALHERKTLLKNAPHLSKALPIFTPCYKWWEKPYYWAGMKAYDLVAGRTTLISSRSVGVSEALATLPTLATEHDGSSLKGGILYYDGQFDDARLAVTLACTAAASGASTVNYMEVTQLIKNQDGKVIGAKCQDKLTKESVDVYARLVINATGPYIDNVRRMSDPQTHATVTASSGAHVALPAYLSSASTGILIPKTSDGRVVFLLPFQNHVIAGTTDIACDVTDQPHSTEDEVSYILKTVSEYLSVRVTQHEVLSTWAGIRPLPSNPKTKAKDTASIVRDHVIFMDDDGMLNVTGGKWTTYRRMSEEVIDAAVNSGRLPLNARPCRTHDMPLLGAGNYRRTLATELAMQVGGSTVASATAPSSQSSPALSTIDHLVESYGDRAQNILQLAKQKGLGAQLVPGHPYIDAEVVYCVQSEYCMTPQDFLSRRTRLAFLDVRAAEASIPRVVALMAPLLNWDEGEKQRQTANAKAFLKQGFTTGQAASGA